MKITVFTSNQPRHTALIEKLVSLGGQVDVFLETVTLFPGQREDFFKKSEVMRDYFGRVTKAERKIFGVPRMIRGVNSFLPMKAGDLNDLDEDSWRETIEEAELIIVFGASYIKSPLVDKLIEKKAINIHMGISPYYRGSSCNFWALYDGKPEMVGATVHFIGKGLDSGEMLFHSLPEVREEEEIDGFILGMKAVEVVLSGLMESIKKGEILDLEPFKQDKNIEVRYSRGRDFTDEIAKDYLLNKMMGSREIKERLKKRDLRQYIRPYILR